MANTTSNDLLLPDIETQTSFPQWILLPFLIISIIESLLGIIGNIFVILIISCIGKSSISHTSHNFFILNLALSDLILCSFTMPLNTYRSIYTYTRFPPTVCKLANSFPAINICVSSLTIVAISIYRYLVVCYPHKKLNRTCLTLIIMISIWFLAILAASPLFIYSISKQVYEDFLIHIMVEYKCLNSINHLCEQKTKESLQKLNVCYESWPTDINWHFLYTIFIFFLQVILPIFIICLTYYQIMVKLQQRSKYRFLIKRHNIASVRNEVRRQRRNNILLLLIVASYAISWLPFNIFYTIVTYSNFNRDKSLVNSLSIEKTNNLSNYLPIRFLICMISAVANPFLYGIFNETFKDGLKKILSLCFPQMIENKNQLIFDQTDIPSFEITLEKHQNGGLASRSHFYLKNPNLSALIQKSTRISLTNSNKPSTVLSMIN